MLGVLSPFYSGGNVLGGRPPPTGPRSHRPAPPVRDSRLGPRPGAPPPTNPRGPFRTRLPPWLGPVIRATPPLETTPPTPLGTVDERGSSTLPETTLDGPNDVDSDLPSVAGRGPYGPGPRPLVQVSTLSSCSEKKGDSGGSAVDCITLCS